MLKPNWLRLPGGIAMALGLGALSTAGARTDLAEAHQRAGLGDAMIRSEGGKIFLSEGGRENELRLSATPQRDHLLRVLEQHGPAGIKLNADPRLIMSGSGGAGFSLRDITKSFTGRPEPTTKNPSQVTTPRSSPKQETGPRDRVTATDKKG
jgi:hypothetical protein